MSESRVDKFLRGGRQTGRTTRMLKAAWAESYRRPVVVMAADQDHARALFQQLKQVIQEVRQVVLTTVGVELPEQVDHNLKIRTLMQEGPFELPLNPSRSPHDDPDGAVFWDHYSLECLAASVVRMACEWDVIQPDKNNE